MSGVEGGVPHGPFLPSQTLQLVTGGHGSWQMAVLCCASLR